MEALAKLNQESVNQIKKVLNRESTLEEIQKLAKKKKIKLTLKIFIQIWVDREILFFTDPVLWAHHQERELVKI